MTAAQVIEQTRISGVWHALGGGEIRRGRGQAFWRKGDGWSVSLNDKRGAWFDHRDGIGGGVLKLIQHVRGGSRGDALRWLADWRGIPLSNAPLSPADKRRYAQARQQAGELAETAEMWWRARREELERAKVGALAREDDAALETAAREHHRLTKMKPDPAAIVAEHLRAQREEPERTAALVAEVRGWAQAVGDALWLVIERWGRETETQTEAAA
jgi:hypothetical protein